MTHPVFVYGTLKQGFPNFHINHGERVGGEFLTTQAYPLYIVGERRLPWLLNQPGQGHPVVGQLYHVDDRALAAMDVLERVADPGWYSRERIVLQPREGGPAVEAWVYFGSAERLQTETAHAGPLAEYTTAHATSYGGPP